MRSDDGTPAPLPADVSPAAKETDDQTLIVYIETLGAPSWLAKHLALRMNNAFGCGAKALIDGFLQQGWSVSELYWLDQWDKSWRQNPQQVFQMERALLDLGMAIEFTRRLIIERPPLRAMELPDLVAILRTMRGMGFTDSEIFSLSRHYFRYFRIKPEAFQAIYDEAQRKRKGVLWQPKAPAQLRSVLPDVPEMLPQRPDEPAEIPAPSEPPMATEPFSGQPAAADEIPPEVIVSPQDISVTADSPPDAATLSEPVPVAQIAVDETGMVIGTMPFPKPPDVPPTAPPPAKEPPAVTTARTELKRVSSIPFPPRVPVAAAPVFPLKREPLPAPYVPEDNVKNWKELGKAIMRAAFPDDFDRVWRKFLRENPWIDTKGAEAKILEHLFTWIPFGQTLPPGDQRALFFASLLLNRNLPAQKRGAERRRGKERLKRENPGLHKLNEALARAKKAKNGKNGLPAPSDLSSVLKLEEEVVYFRMYACRRILEQHDPLQYPEGLCYPWEQVIPYAPPLPRNFSIPPPPLTDERLWIAKRDELRFRVNYLRDLGWRPERKPFLLMIQEPTREKFLKRLNRYLKKENPEKDRRPRFRRNKEIITPQSPLS